VNTRFVLAFDGSTWSVRSDSPTEVTSGDSGNTGDTGNSGAADNHSTTVGGDSGTAGDGSDATATVDGSNIAISGRADALTGARG
jgi:hypothetical protein